MPKSVHKPKPAGAAGRLLEYVEEVVKDGGSIGESLDDSSKGDVLVRLRTAVPFVQAIAVAGDKLNASDDLVSSTVHAMKRAADEASGRTPKPDETCASDFESWYLLGILVGLEMARAL